MDTRETCREKIGEVMQDRESDIKALLADESDDVNLYEFILSVDTKRITSICLSYGGPADYLEVVHIGSEIESVTYRYSDWFDTATRSVPEGSPLYEYAAIVIEERAANDE